MASLYEGYCLTANADTTTTAASSKPTSAKSTAGATSDSAQNSGSTPTETAPASSSSSSGTGSGGKEGLSQSDIVALAASLGVGIPSLIIAAITLCVQLRKRKKNQMMVTEKDAHQAQPYTEVEHNGTQNGQVNRF